MNKLFFDKKTKVSIDFLLIVGIILLAIYHDTGKAFATTWHSYHCIISIIWFLIMTIHIWQNWSFIKALSKVKFAKNNKIITIVFICFALMTISIILLIFGFNNHISKYHNIIGHIFILVIVIHLITKFRKMMLLLHKK